MYNTFTWTDLSTFDVEACKQFYGKLFDWQFTSSKDRSMTNAYHLAYQHETAVAAVFAMPDYLQKINMPSFWMSYIQVEDIKATVTKARQHEGVIIEVEPTAFDADSKIALIRDSSGAGFTVYEGPNLDGRFSDGHGRLIWNVHHVSDKELIEHFYQDVFSWTLHPISKNRYEVVHEQGEVIAHIEALPETIKGDKQYWMPIFAVSNLAKSKGQINHLGGSVLIDMDTSRSLCTDPQGGHFLIQQNDLIQQDESDNQGLERDQNLKAFKWKAVLGLILVWFAVFAELNWIWGILFLLWVVPDLRSRETHFLEYISARANPLLYWLIMSSWLTFSIYLILVP